MCKSLTNHIELFLLTRELLNFWDTIVAMISKSEDHSII